MKQIATALRFALLGFCVLVAVWAFATVGHRQFARWQTQRTQKVQLTMLHWGAPAENKIVDDLVAAYEAKNPDVKILNISVSDFQSKLKTMMAAGTPPDIFYLPPELLADLANLDLIEPVDDLVAADKAKNGSGYFDDIFPILLDSFRYDTQTKVRGSGKLYGLPKDFTTVVFYANRDLCAAAGVDVDAIQKNGWTWDDFEVANRKIRALNGRPEYSGRNIYGSVIEIWHDTVRQMLWSFGGDFFGTNPDGTANFRDVTIDEPAAQNALRYIQRLRGLTPGSDAISYNATGAAKAGDSEFAAGNIGFDGPVGRWKVPELVSTQKFKWDVVPLPTTPGVAFKSQIFLTAWTMSSKTPHKAQVYDLLKFLCGPEGAKMQSELGLAVPPLKSVAYSPAFLSPPQLPRHNAQIYLDAIPHAAVQQLPVQPEWSNIVNDNISASIQLGSTDTLTNAKTIESTWLNELDSPLRQREWPAMNWSLIGAIAAICIVLAVAAFIWSARREKLGPLDRASQRTGYMFIAPWVIGFLALTAGPMIISLILSFARWSAMTPMSDAQSVGLANYKQLFSIDKSFRDSLWVTGYYILLAVPISQVAALAVALLMNLRLRGIATFRTIYFVPSVIGVVAISMLALQVFNNDYGVLNRVLRLPPVFWHSIVLSATLLISGGAFLQYIKTKNQSSRFLAVAGLIASAFTLLSAVLFWALKIHSVPPDWFGKDAPIWAIPGFVLIGLWGVGGGMIIYLAGLKGIPASLYEAATIDGAGPARRLWNVTLPQLSPLIFYNLVMGIIGAFQVFTQAFIMTGPGPGNATLFYVLQLYRQAFVFHNMGYASAIAWVLFVIILAVTLLVFGGSKKLIYYEGLK